MGHLAKALIARGFAEIYLVDAGEFLSALAVEESKASPLPFLAARAVLLPD